MIQIGDETYLLAAAAARYIGISRPTFYNNVKHLLVPYKFGARKLKHYRKNDLEQFKNVQPVA